MCTAARERPLPLSNPTIRTAPSTGTSKVHVARPVSADDMSRSWTPCFKKREGILVQPFTLRKSRNQELGKRTAGGGVGDFAYLEHGKARCAGTAACGFNGAMVPTSGDPKRGGARPKRWSSWGGISVPKPKGWKRLDLVFS